MIGLVLAALIVAQDATTLMRDAFRLIDNKDRAAVAVAFEKCRAAAAAEGNRIANGECTRGLGRLAQEKRDYTAARRLFEAAHDELAVANEHALLARNYNDRAYLSFVENKPAEVREFYGLAAHHFGAAGRIGEQAAALRSQTFTSDMPISERLVILERAWELARSANATRIEALVLHHWSDNLYLRGDYALAIAKVERAIALLESDPDVASLARALSSLGRLYRVHGALPRAIAMYTRVLALQEAAKDVTGQAQTLTMIGSALISMSSAREALTYHERALALVKQAGTPAQVAYQLGGLAFNLIQLEEFAAAERDASEAIGLSSGHPHDLGLQYSYLAQAQFGLGRSAEAFVNLDRSLALVRQLGQVDLEIPLLCLRADMLEASSGGAAALRPLGEAARLVEQQRAKLAPSDFLKSSFADLYESVATRTILLLNASGRVAEAATLAEQTRSRAFLDLLAGRDAGLSRPDVRTDPGAAPPPSAAGWGLTMRGGASASRSDGTDLASSAAATMPTEDTIRNTAARLRSTVISYWVGEKATLIFVVAPGGALSSYRVAVTRGRLERLVRRTWSLGPAAMARRGSEEAPRDSMTVAAADRALSSVTLRGGEALAPNGLESSAYRDLYELLIRPMRSALPPRDGLLTIVPHGPLFELSFAALTDTRGRFLLEDYRLHYTPSAATLEFTGRRAAATTTASRYLFVANPATQASAAEQPLVPLPGAEREVRAVSRLLGSRQATTLVGAAATEDAIQRAIDHYRVVHFATHGLVSIDNPLESFLALAPGKTSGTDGRLTAAEIYGMRLSADLVVLSACRSAGGKISGDGIVGLTRAFFTAGTPSIVAALWDIADESAEHVLPRFYAEWLKSGDKGRALRAAQLSMLRDLRAGRITVNTPFGALPLPPHPALWANLVLIGEPR